MIQSENMNQNKMVLPEHYYGYLTFENFWGEDLERVILTHSLGRYADLLKDKKEFGPVADKEILKDIFGFNYIVGRTTDYWNIKFWTQRGSAYQSTLGFSCDITENDHGRVTLGINGESERMYIAFPSSSNCSTAIYSD